MRIALFTDSDEFAGTERHIFDLACGLQDRGAEVRVACPVPSPLAEKATVRDIPVVPIAKQGLMDRAAIARLRALLRAGTVSIVHAHNGRTRLSAAIAVRQAGAGRCIATQHFLEPDHVSRKGPKGLLYRAAHRWVNGNVAQFLAVSEAARQGMLARREAPPQKISVVPNGIPPPDVREWASPAAVRRGLGVADDDEDVPLIVAVGRLEAEKDFAGLIAAMKTVAAARPGAVCVIAGEGTQRPALEAQIAAAGLGGSVRLLGFRSDAMALINAGDIFVLPSRMESFGLAALEAMALGKPVVATRCGGPEEVVVPEETGLLVPTGQPDALAAALTRLLWDAPLRRSLGEKGKERFLACYTLEQMARATFAVYEKALRGRPGG